MSLLSRDHLIVSLSPERLNAIRLGGRWRRQFLDQHAVALPASTPSWMSGLEALELLLDDLAWGSRGLSVILSGHHVFYAVLPKGERLAAKEQADLARLIFRNIFGELAHDWVLRVSPAGHRRPLASGIPQAMLNALLAACGGRAILQSIQPGLMTVFNRSRAIIDQQSGVLALVEQGRITLAAIEQGEWQSIASRAWEASALPELMAEAHALSGLESSGRLWLCDLTGQAVAPPPPAWRLERLTAGAFGAGSLAGWGIA